MESIRLRKLQLKSRHIRDSLIKEPYCWPGGYARFAITDEGGIICKACAKKEAYLIGHTYGGDGWALVAVESTANVDIEIYCDHCSSII